MKILAVSDIHQSFKTHDGRDESHNFEKFLEVIKIEKPKLVLICGDTEDVSDIDMRALKKLSHMLDFKTFIILGNHDNKSVIKRSGMLLNGLDSFNNISIAGINGITAPVHYNNVLTFAEDRLFNEAKRIKRELDEKMIDLDILLTHEMPKIHAGYERDFYNERSSFIFSDILYLLKPKLAISGHLHGNKTLIAEYEYGIVVNLGAFAEGHYAIIEVENNPFTIKRIKPVKFA